MKKKKKNVIKKKENQKIKKYLTTCDIYKRNVRKKKIIY